MFRSHWKTLLLIAFIAGIFYWRPLWSGEYTILAGFENTNQAYSWYHFVASSLKHGILPAWDPYTFGGRSFPGEMQTGAFYPLNLLIAALPFNNAGFFSPHIYTYLFVASRILGAFLMFLLLRELNRSYFASLLAGVCVSFGGVVQGMLSWPDRYQSIIWLPLGLLFAIRSLKAGLMRPRFLYGALCGIVLGLPILAGGLHIVMMQMIVLATAIIAYVAFRRDTLNRSEWRQCWVSAATVLGIALVFAAATGAAQLLASLEYSAHSVRWVVGGELPANQKIPYERMNEGLLPNALTILLFAAPATSIVNGEFLNPYLGVLTFGLALVGVWRAWRNRWVKYLTGLAVVSYAYAMASYSFLHGALYILVPRLWMAREANRFMYMADFSLAVLAAFGIDALLDRSLSESLQPLRKILRWVGGIAAVALFIPTVYGSPAMSPWVALSLVLILASAALMAYVLRGNRGTVAKVAMALLILSDVYAFDWSFRSIRQTQAKGEDELYRLRSAKPAVDYVKAQPGLFRLGVSADLPPSVGLYYGIQTNSGTAATMPTDFNRIRHRDDLLNVRYILTPASDSRPNPVYQDAAWKVYPNEAAFPRAWVVHQIERRETLGAVLERLDNADFDARRTALVAGPADAPLDPPQAGVPEQATVTNYEPHRIRLSVNAGGRALLVLSENYFPGWKATVNGRPVTILKADGGLRAVPVPGGNSTVEFRYAPAYLTTGLPVTILTLLFGVAASVLLISMRTGKAVSDALGPETDESGELDPDAGISAKATRPRT